MTSDRWTFRKALCSAVCEMYGIIVSLLPDKTLLQAVRRSISKATSLRLGNFSREEIHDLYMQHTAATGQEFDEGCFPFIWTATEGQPWLVNALGYEVTMEMKENRDRSIRIIP